MSRGLEKSFAAISLTLISVLIFSAAVLSASSVSADNSHVDDVSIIVPISCNLNSTNTTHSDTVNPNTTKENIGKTTLRAFCNDKNGFAIYAIGYTGDEDGTTTLIGNNTSQTITTGTDTSSNSSWSMKVTKETDSSIAYLPTNMTIDNGYDDYNVVPTNYTKVATFSSATDTAEPNGKGAVLYTTYKAHIAPGQAADTYSGKVKYTLIHPANAPTPVPVSKNLYYAITGTANNYTLTISDSDITSGAVASGPVAIDGYTVDEDEMTVTTPWVSYISQIKSVVVDGTVAPTSTSGWFAELGNCDSWDLSGLKTDHVTDMSYMFADANYEAASFNLDLSSWDTSNVTNMSGMFNSAGHNATTFTLNISSWDTSSVTDMSHMFYQAGYNATTWSISDLSSWDTSNVTNMSNMFAQTGRYATTWSVGNLSSWDTSKVTDMSYMFESAGYSANILDIGYISSWNTSSVTDMSGMFTFAGYSASSFTLNLSNWNTSSVLVMIDVFRHAGYSASSFTLNLSNWNTSSVTGMNYMFSNAGNNATTWSVTIPKTNNGTATGSISNTTSRLYGNNTYIAPPSGRSFTLAN